MYETIIHNILNMLVELLVPAVLAYGTYALTKAKGYLKSKMNEKHYNVMTSVAHDIYQYVEREYGDKLYFEGAEKLEIASELFNKKMKELGIPYSAEDFKIQVEKIIKAEKESK
jgi:putative NADPH-quinone reductase